MRLVYWPLLLLVGCGPAVDTEGGESSGAEDGSTSGSTTNAPDPDPDPGPSTAPVTSSPATSDTTTGIGDETGSSSTTTTVGVEDQYYVSLATIVAETTPFQFIGTVKADGEVIGMSLTPLSLDVLSVDSPRELVPPAIEVGGIIDPDGLFTIEAPNVELVGAVNPITGSDIVADLTIQGEFVGDLICGRVSGMVTVPTMIQLEGSRFSAMPVSLGDNPSSQDIPLPGDIACP
jgi:hypothetical protein